MKYHNTTPFIDSLEFYVHASQETVVEAFNNSLTENIPGIYVHHISPVLTVINMRYEASQSTTSWNYCNLVYVRKLLPSRYTPFERSKVSIHGSSSVEEVFKHLDQCMLNINMLNWKKNTRCNNRPKVYPIVHSEICRIDLTIDICTRRISYELLLALIDKTWQTHHYNNLHRITGFTGTSYTGRTLYLGNTRRSAFSIRLYEKGKHLNSQSTQMHPQHLIRLEAVYRFKKGMRPSLVTQHSISALYAHKTYDIRKHPLIHEVLFMANRHISAKQYTESLTAQFKDTIDLFKYDSNAYLRFAKIQDEEVYSMLIEDLYVSDYFDPEDVEPVE